MGTGFHRKRGWEVKGDGHCNHSPVPGTPLQCLKNKVLTRYESLSLCVFLCIYELCQLTLHIPPISRVTSKLRRVKKVPVEMTNLHVFDKRV